MIAQHLLMIKKIKTSGNTCKVCDCFLEYANFKDDLKNTIVYVATKSTNRSLTKI